MSQDFPDLEGYQIDDSWAVAHSSIRNLPVIVRLRPNLIDIAGHPQLSHRIRVIWKYQPDSEFGLPATEEMTSMDVCENELIESLEKDNQTIMTHILTGCLLYTSDAADES